MPRRCRRSARFTPAAATSMRSSFAASAGAGTSPTRSTDSSPGWSKTTAFMGGEASSPLAARTIKRAATSRRSVGRVDLAATLAYIEKNLGGDLSLEALARRAGLSPYQFYRQFRARVGEPPKRYVRRLRLERAAAWLKLSSCHVTEVALGAGYATHEAFTRAFRARFGVSPLRFRAALAKREVPAGFLPRIARFPARRVAFVRYVGPYDCAGEAFERLARWAAPRALLGGAMLAVYLDDQDITPPERTRCDVALFAGDHVGGEGEIGVRELPGGDH